MGSEARAGQKGVGPDMSLSVWQGRGFGLRMESWNESGETAELLDMFFLDVFLLICNCCFF